PLPDPSRFGAPDSPRPAPEQIARAASVLSGAAAPVMLVGRGRRTLESWRARVALAEKLGARVMTDLKTGASFPTRHPLHIGPPGTYLSEAAATAVRESDVILALDWIDLAGTLKQVYGDRRQGRRGVVRRPRAPGLQHGLLRAAARRREPPRRARRGGPAAARGVQAARSHGRVDHGAGRGASHIRRLEPSRGGGRAQ